MRSTRPVYSVLFFLLFTLITLTTVVRAQEDDAESEDYEVKARVMRVSLLSDEVKLQRHDNPDWERAQLNYPVVEGDTLSTGDDSRLEIQIDTRNFIRVGPNSILKVASLRDEGVALSVVEGTVSLRLAKFEPDKEFFEIDAPKTTLAPEKEGLYRVDVDKDGRVRLTARNGGRARIYSEKSGFALRDGRTAELLVDGPDAGEWELVVASASDAWDTWVDEREQRLAHSIRNERRHYDDDVWGAEDLDSYGEWTNTSEYGWIWRPHTSVISSYTNWAPYRYGHWTWVPPYGWTWVGSEPWGWAPYHYGRWVYHNGYWAWSPRSQFHQQRSWWRPALVAFVVNISFGDQIYWYPLNYHDRDPRSRNYHRHRDRDRNRRHDRDPRERHGRWRGVTAVPRRDFGGRNTRPLHGDERWGRRVAQTDPVPDVPVRPAREINRPDTESPGNRPRRWTIARRESVPGVQLPQRRTGAAERQPGVPLDRNLRRTRGWNGRERVPQPLDPAGGAAETNPRTGAVRRPTWTLSEEPTSGDRGAKSKRRPVADPPPAQPNPATPATVTPSQVEPPVPATPIRRPSRIPSRQDQSPGVAPTNEEPAAPDAGVRPTRRERSEEASPRPITPRRRVETPEPNPPTQQEQPRPFEPPTRHERVPRSDPPPRNDPPPRSDPPARRDPPPRNEPPPRNDPPPPNDPPARNQPAPQNDPPPRNDTPRPVEPVKDGDGDRQPRNKKPPVTFRFNAPTLRDKGERNENAAISFFDYGSIALRRSGDSPGSSPVDAIDIRQTDTGQENYGSHIHPCGIKSLCG